MHWTACLEPWFSSVKLVGLLRDFAIDFIKGRSLPNCYALYDIAQYSLNGSQICALCLVYYSTMPMLIRNGSMACMIEQDITNIYFSKTIVVKLYIIMKGPQVYRSMFHPTCICKPPMYKQPTSIPNTYMLTVLHIPEPSVVYGPWKRNRVCT